MSTYQKKHQVEKIPTTSSPYEWGIFWNNFVICLCAEKEIAEEIAEALDAYKPFFVEE